MNRPRLLRKVKTIRAKIMDKGIIYPPLVLVLTVGRAVLSHQYPHKRVYGQTTRASKLQVF